MRIAALLGLLFALLRGVLRFAYGLESYEPLDGGTRWAGRSVYQ